MFESVYFFGFLFFRFEPGKIIELVTVSKRVSLQLIPFGAKSIFLRIE